jgi:hypothetical protein
MWVFSIAAQHGLAALCLAVCVYLYLQITTIQDDIRSLIVCYRDLFVQAHRAAANGNGERKGMQKNHEIGNGLDYKHQHHHGNGTTRNAMKRGVASRSSRPETSNVKIAMEQMFDLPSCNPDVQQTEKRTHTH